MTMLKLIAILAFVIPLLAAAWNAVATIKILTFEPYRKRDHWRNHIE
jgi:hypothetical protein